MVAAGVGETIYKRLQPRPT